MGPSPDPKLLVPVDGSDNALRAVAHAVRLKRRDPGLVLHLITVRPALRSDVTTFIDARTVKDFHREEGDKALASARALLDREGIAHEVHIGVGPAGETIAAFARDLGCDQIVMGTRGLGRTLSLLLGSVATDVIKHAEVPVTLVK